jgi:hypothetical protein
VSAAASELADHHAGFHAAWSTGPGTERRYAFGGLPLVVRTTGAALARVVDRPLLPLGPGRLDGPVLRADLFTVEGAASPAPAAHALDLDERAVGVAGERIAATRDGRAVRFSGPCWSWWLDVGARHVVGWVSDVDGLPPWQRMRPFAAFLGPWLRGTGRRVLHASTAVVDGAAVVLPGGDGVGKSTTAMACAEAGYAVLADDVVAVELGAPTAHTLYTTLKLRVPPVATDAVEQHLDPEGAPEWVVFQRDAPAGKALVASAPIAAFGLPALHGALDTDQVPVSAPEAVRTLLAADQMRDGQLAEAFEAWSRLVERIPVARVRIGRDPTTIPPVIKALRGGAA